MSRLRAAFVLRSGALAAIVAIAACSGEKPASTPAGAIGSSIAYLSGKNQVAVVNPDQGSVSIVDAGSLATLSTIDVGGEPHALLETKTGNLLVANYRAGEIVSVDPASGTVTGRRAICNGPYGLASSPDGAFVAVACEWDGSVLRIDPTTLAATKIATGLSRPRAVAVVGDGKSASVVVAEFTGGNVVHVAGDGTVSRVSLVPSSAPYRPALTKMTANLAAAFSSVDGKLAVAYELVNHTGDASLEKIAGDYGSVKDGNPKINPAVGLLAIAADGTPSLTNDTVLYSTFDGGPRVFNGPTGLATLDDHHVLVADVSTNDIAVIDTSISDPAARAVGSYAVGAGPHGIAIDSAHHFAFVDNMFDGSVSKLDLSQATRLTSPATQPVQTQIRSLPEPYSAAARAGRKLFYDASNTHVTPSAVVVCATCHPGGTDDGLIWFMQTSNIPLKRRRTPSLFNAHSGTAPFHWNGQFATMEDLTESTITDLMAGDGLLVDLPSMQAYIDEIVKPPVAPAGDADAIARGHTVFTSQGANCSSCHSGADFTDNQMHAVLDPESLTDDDSFSAANTPGLHGLFLRAPYFHDGRSPTLQDLLTRGDATAHGGASTLAPNELSDLVAYLSSL